MLFNSTDVARLLSNTVTQGECLLYTKSKGRDGYGWFKLHGKTITAHRAAWLFASGSLPPAGLGVLHTCDCTDCLLTEGTGTYEMDGRLFERRGHLWLGTVADNNRDRSLKGRSASGDRNWKHLHPESSRGERNGRAILTEEQVRDIRQTYKPSNRWYPGKSREDFAAEYGVSKALINKILQGKLWPHLK